MARLFIQKAGKNSLGWFVFVACDNNIVNLMFFMGVYIYCTYILLYVHTSMSMYACVLTLINSILYLLIMCLQSSHFVLM